MKTLLKNLYYAFKAKELTPYSLNLGIIFHTEVVFDKTDFLLLMKFCKDYKALTNVQPICTLMSGVNPRIQAGIKEAKISMDEFVNRIRQLEEVACLGYHGHFHIDVNQYKLPENEVHCNNYVDKRVKEQLENDLEWFDLHKIDHRGVYAPGWFFMNEHLLKHLSNHGFHTDYSFSNTKWFRNEYSNCLMHSNQIATGEAFRIDVTGKEMLCIQNLIGTHNSPIMRDFDRNLGDVCNPTNPIIQGVISVHDNDIEHTIALRGVEYLMKTYNANFLGHEEHIQFAKNQKIKTVSSEIPLNKQVN